MKSRIKKRTHAILCIDCGNIASSDPFYQSRCGACLTKFYTQERTHYCKEWDLEDIPMMGSRHSKKKDTHED